MPPDGHRSEGTPSFSEVPYAWGEPFFAYFFLAFEKKVSRRKGETLSGRYRSNGYVHLQKKVGCQAAIASRLAPTVDRGISAESGPPPISHNETSHSPLAPTPHPSTINQRKIVLAPPQVQGPDYRHSTNRKRPQTTENRPSCRQNLLWMNVPLTDITGLPILMAT
jgi:hypothetical protein